MKNLEQLSLDECITINGGGFFTNPFFGLQENAIEGIATFSAGFLLGIMEGFLS